MCVLKLDSITVSCWNILMKDEANTSNWPRKGHEIWWLLLSNHEIFLLCIIPQQGQCALCDTYFTVVKGTGVEILILVSCTSVKGKETTECGSPQVTVTVMPKHGCVQHCLCLCPQALKHFFWAPPPLLWDTMKFQDTCSIRHWRGKTRSPEPFVQNNLQTGITICTPGLKPGGFHNPKEGS